jgi:hypothetical protein
MTKVQELKRRPKGRKKGGRLMSLAGTTEVTLVNIFQF